MVENGAKAEGFMLKSRNPFLEGCVKGLLLTLPPMICGYAFPHHAKAAFMVGISISGVIAWCWSPKRQRAQMFLLVAAVISIAGLVCFLLP